MKLIAWLILAAIGIGMSIWAYHLGQPPEGFTPVSSGVIVVARSASQRFDGPIPFPSTKAGVVQLPVPGLSAMLAMSSGGGSDRGRGRGLRFQLSEKLIQVPIKEAGISEASLAWGKLPRQERNEVLAGAQAAHQDQVEVAETIYKVTGGLRRETGLFARSYVLPESDRTGEHGDEGDAGFHPAVLIPLGPDQLVNPKTHEQLQKRFPAKEYNSLVCFPLMPPGAFYLHLLGQAIFLLGGCAALFSLYGMVAARSWPGVLRDPFVAVSSRRRLNWGIHVAYFGLYLGVAALMYRAPDLWNAMQAIIRGEIAGESRTLEFAGNAYLSGNVAWAALVTFGTNFFLRSLSEITLPSCIIPGSGALLAAVRALFWGLLLAPVTLVQAWTMLPHSGTVLLEGEGYILATFFGLMLAESIFRTGPDTDSRFSQRYVRGLVLNLKGLLLVAVVLAIAAIYEATEVIWSSKAPAGRVEMSDSVKLGILEQPLQPSAFWRCPKCRGWFAFKKVREEKSEISGKVKTYRCDQCGHEEKFAERHPPHAI